MPNKLIPDLDVAVSSHLAAILLDTSDNNLRRMRSEGGGPAYVKEGRNVFYRVGVLADYSKREFSMEHVSRCALDLRNSPTQLRGNAA